MSVVAAAPVSELRAGWRVVAGAAIGMGTGVGLYLLMMSLFVVHLSQAFGWSRGDLGVAGMIAFLSGAVSLPIVGRLTDRFGFRRIVMICVPALALLYLLIANQPGYYPFHLVLAMLGGTVGAGTGAVAYTRPLIATFERQRGAALGFATGGTSVVTMIVPPVLVAVIGAYGWRAGLYAMSAITGLVGLPLAIGLIGRAREGAARSIHDMPATAWSPPDPEVRECTLREALRGSRFWLLAGALVAVNIPGSGVVGQLAPLVGDKGLAGTAVGIVMSIYSAGLLAGRLITGFWLDRMPAHLVATVMTAIPAIGIALLLVPSSSFALAAVAVALIGMQQGSEIDLVAYFVSRSFGVTHYGAIYGAVAIAGAVSTAAALVFFGRVHDITGSYDVALTVGAVAFCVGAAAFASLGRARP
jgi:MFS family permease